MKIRINGNSLRLRLSQKEVTDLVVNGLVTSVCHFPQGAFQYSIKTSDKALLSAEISDGDILVHVPHGFVDGWDGDERVGFDYRDESGLYILVEKDFQCLKPRPEEDESGLFPNPQADQPHSHC
jgi:hypothetical protein